MSKTLLGSPPRMRGKGRRWPESVAANGITPAYAGKSSGPMQKFGMSGDHPRVCGEKQRTLAVQDEPQGSPPRVRGKAFGTTLPSCASGITPARAGKRVSARLTRPTRRDHPRACGEKTRRTLPRTPKTGSPPRVRGKALFANLQRPGERITPARAGKRPAGGHHRAASRDHPRACGEKFSNVSVV